MRRIVLYQSIAFVAALAPQQNAATRPPLEAPVFRKPFNAAEQQFAALSLAPIVAAVVATGDTAWQPLNPELVRKPLNADEQQFSGYTPQRVPTALDVQGVFAQPDIRGARPFAVSAQQFSALGLPPSAQPQGSFASTEPRFAKPFPASAQQFSGLTPQRVPSALDAQGFLGGFEARFAKAVQAATQQYSAFLLSPQASPQGFAGYQFDIRFAKAVPAATQQFLSFAPEHVPSALDVEGFFGFPGLDVRFASKVPASVQQFLALVVTTQAAQTQPIEGWRSPFEIRFKAPLPASQQPFQAWRIDTIPDVIPEPPAPPGHGSYPWKKKPVRPVWDRAPAKAPLPALMARATLIEADDTAAASARIRVGARADMTETDDIARSAISAVWADDEIILQMLLEGDL